GVPNPVPNPYAQGGGGPYAPPPQQPPQPGYGYQQPQAQPGYGYPQQPQPPQGGGGKGKTMGLVIGAVVVVGAIVGGVVLMGGGSGDDGGKLTDDGKQYRLTAPQTVLGVYTSKDSDSEPLTGEKAEAFGLTTGTGVNVEWAAAGDAKKLELLGAYGEVKDPEKSVDTFFSTLKKKTEAGGSDSDALVVGTPERKSPEGFENGVMKCQMLKAKEEPSPDEPGTLTLCTWADYDTVATVVPREGTKSLTLDEAAKIAADLRKEVRVEVPKSS
ncbi:hypothetical protein AB4212_21510, partial [Streptomyces sp. 2MCAF27]